MRLGLIAMSGVRAHDPELTRLGLTLPGFVERNKKIASLPSLGLLTLAGMTPSSVEVQYMEVEDLAELDGLPGDLDVAAISSYSAQIGEAYALADRFRQNGIPVILGGLHVTAVPDEALRHADAIVIGEAEPVWNELIHDLQNGGMKPCYDARQEPFDLAHAPMPAFELLDCDRYNRLTVQTQRGCPFQCEFCASSILLAPTFRVKPVQKVVDEIRRVKSLWRRPFIEFADDNTFANRKHGKELMAALASEDIRWFTETDISIARDEQLLGMMRDSGCVQVLIGLESPSTNQLHGVELHSDWKAKQCDQYAASIERIQSHGISVNGCFVLGLDGADPQSFDDILNFVKSSKLHEVQITVQTPFPGTPLYRRLEREGRLIRPEAWEYCTLFDVNFQPSHMTVEELRGGLRGLAEQIYGDEMTRQRKRHFHAHLRTARMAQRNGRNRHEREAV
jgi:radical SAM superfamily enzyme YgiQ (UPF0313 family)